jgi:hypothetical protein
VVCHHLLIVSEGEREKVPFYAYESEFHYAKSGAALAQRARIFAF